jgi:hypothetical protein
VADRKWAEVYAQLDRGAAGVDDFDRVRRDVADSTQHGSLD